MVKGLKIKYLTVDPCRYFGISNVNESENVVAKPLGLHACAYTFARVNVNVCIYECDVTRIVSIVTDVTHTSYLNSASVLYTYPAMYSTCLS